ncbi:hypothetical protein ASD44_06585 [Mesorhizobium sp. Root554]|nr:hypothetical protein ASD27_06590 [Mesorhizobium sp. Root1471]KQZ36287.1 hypothetical protein ASD44_06585 [Mesorhizobium sp. Root554]
MDALCAAVNWVLAGFGTMFRLGKLPVFFGPASRDCAALSSPLVLEHPLMATSPTIATVRQKFPETEK